MTYPNLAAEMARNGITERDIAEVAEKSPDTIRNCMRGKGDIPIGKALIIRERFFTKAPIEYLYASTPAKPPVAQQI